MVARRAKDRVGVVPGTVDAAPESPKPALRLIAFDEKILHEERTPTMEQIRKSAEAKEITWVDVEGLGDAETIKEIGRIFQIHALSLEDVVNTHQRPKVEVYDDYIFVVVRMAIAGDQHRETEQVAMFIGDRFVVSFQEREGDAFEPVRDRLRRGLGRIRRMRADYLGYALVDAIVDHFFPILETYEQQLEILEDELLIAPQADVPKRIYAIRHELTELRRSIAPLMSSMTNLARETLPFVQKETRLYFRDLIDHVARLLDQIESERETAAGLMDFYMSRVGQRMNEVMKVLTVISTIFIPLSFVTGLYGMNFINMPELNWRFGYVTALLVMATSVVTFLLDFKRKGWMRNDEPEPPARK